MSRIHIIALGLTVGSLTGCEQPLACTTEARSSVTVEVIDDLGNPVPDPVGTYAVDGGAEEACESWQAGSLVCGWEVAGDFSITVDAAGFDPETVSVTVGADECHVISETVSVQLMPVSCTDSLEPSVLVTVTDVQGTQITAADVVWNMADEDDLPDPCTSIGGNQWTCAYEVAGDLRIEIDNAGPYESFSQIVTVEADECHVITESLDAVLQFLPD